MVQILPQEPGLGELLGLGVSQGVQTGLQGLVKNYMQKKQAPPLSEYQQIQTKLREKELLQKEKSLEEKPKEEQKKREYTLIQDYAKKMVENESTSNIKQSAINLAKNAFESGNLGTFSRDYLAELTGLEGFRSAKGAQALVAGKEFFLGNLGRVKSRGINQWLEKQIREMQPVIGRSREANLTAVAVLQNEIDLSKKEQQLFNEYMDLADQGKIGYRKVPYLVSKEIDSYASQKEKDLIKEIRHIKKLYGNPDKFDEEKPLTGQIYKNPTTGQRIRWTGTKFEEVK